MPRKPYEYENKKGFKPYTLLFISVVKLSIRQADSKFLLNNEHLDYLAEICGVDNCMVEKIRANYIKSL